MPVMSTTKTVPEESGSPDPLFEQPIGDIADPPQPLETIAAQAQARIESLIVNPNTIEGQAMINLDEALYKFSQHGATVLNAIDKSWDAALRVLNHNNNALLCLKEALQGWAPHTPYSVSIQVVSPSGYPMSIAVEALTQEDFLGKVSAMMGFLSSNGFTPGYPCGDTIHKERGTA
jgi:hypothetical protein